jgi:vitamin B12 transporter
MGTNVSFPVDSGTIRIRAASFLPRFRRRAIAQRHGSGREADMTQIPSTTFQTAIHGVRWRYRARFCVAMTGMTLAMILAGPTFAAQDNDERDSTLPDTYVTASQVPVPAEAVGSAASVVTDTQIEQSQERHAGEVLRRVPGISVNRTSTVGNLAQVRIRGAEGNHTMVIIDGIKVNDLAIGDEFNFAHLLTYDIGEMEVLRGPQSSLYGSDALGGVVSIGTRRATEPFEASFVGEGGSFGTGAGSLRLGSADDDYDIALTTSYFRTSGFNIADDGNENDGFDLLNASLRGGFMPTENLAFDFSGRIATGTNEFDDGDPTTDNPLLETDFFNVYGRGQGTLTLFDGAWEHILGASIVDTANDGEPGSEFSTDTYGETFTADYQTNIFFDTPSFADAAHSFSFLAEREYESYRQQGQVSIFGDPNFETHATNYGYAGEYRVSLWDNLFLSGAFRHDDNELFDSSTTWRTTAAYLFEDYGTRLHGSYGTGVKNPTFIEIYGLFSDFIGNPSLTPESSEGFDVGVEQSFLDDRLIVDVTYFHQNLEDEITNIFVPDGMGGFVGTVVNLPGESERQGIEVSLNTEPFEGFTLYGAYTWLDSEDANGVTEIRRPKHIASLFANYEFMEARANVNLGIEYNGKQTDTDFAVFPSMTRTLDEFVLVSLTGSYELTENIELFGRVENLLDEDYEEVFGNNTPGIGVYAGFRVGFQSE